MLFREIEQTAREGSRAGSASHGTRCASSTGTGPRYAPVPTEGRVPKASPVVEQQPPRARRRAQLLWRGRSKVGGRARDRCLGVQWAWLPPQPSLAPQKHASEHDHHMLCMISPVRIDSSLAGVEMCSCWAQVVVGMGCKASGRVVHLGVRLAATCSATRPLGRRENGLARIDLFHRVYPPR